MLVGRLRDEASEEIFVNGAARKIGMAGTVGKALQKLKSTLEMIAAVTSDIKKKQMKDKVVQLWLRRLQDVAYDADDLLDEISYQAMRQSKKMEIRISVDVGKFMGMWQYFNRLPFQFLGMVQSLSLLLCYYLCTDIRRDGC